MLCSNLEYGAPFEYECNDGVDNDGDGAADFEDMDCAQSECVAVPAYMVQTYDETLCDDGEDNDGDGLIDCDDDCRCDAP